MMRRPSSGGATARPVRSVPLSRSLIRPPPPRKFRHQLLAPEPDTYDNLATDPPLIHRRGERRA
jgi:hypothetical protein